MNRREAAPPLTQLLPLGLEARLGAARLEHRISGVLSALMGRAAGDAAVMQRCSSAEPGLLHEDGGMEGLDTGEGMPDSRRLFHTEELRSRVTAELWGVPGGA